MMTIKKTTSSLLTSQLHDVQTLPSIHENDNLNDVPTTSDTGFKMHWDHTDKGLCEKSHLNTVPTTSDTTFKMHWHHTDKRWQLNDQRLALFANTKKKERCQLNDQRHALFANTMKKNTLMKCCTDHVAFYF